MRRTCRSQYPKPAAVGAAIAMAALLGCASERLAKGHVVGAPPGSPLAGLSDAQLDDFYGGQELFNRPFSPEEGLGPLYNQDRCSSCHDLPVSGGSGTETATIATRFSHPATCDPLLHEGGSNVQQRSTPLLRARGVLREENPSSASARTSVTPPSLFGLGLIEAVPLSVLERRADPEDIDGDGISGKLGITEDGRPARFGRKAEFASLDEFVDAALRFEMGLTTPSHPSEQTLNGSLLPDGVDPASDPEMSEDDLRLLAAFIRYLAPSGPDVAASEAEQSITDQGEQLFVAIGCGQCHVPTFVTGKHSTAAMNEKTFYIYSDMLLHDLGPDRATVCGAGALPSEFRTSRLTGLRFRDRFLYDGSAGSVRAAIESHGGEATTARDAFLKLDQDARATLLQFVGSR